MMKKCTSEINRHIYLKKIQNKNKKTHSAGWNIKIF